VTSVLPKNQSGWRGLYLDGMTRTSSALLVAIALTLGACGGDDELLVDTEADEALVNAAVLTLEDLPEGFVEEPADDDDDENEDADECLEDAVGLTRDEFEDARTARSDSVQFESDEDTVSIRARVSAFESSDVPGEAIDAFDTDEFLECLRESFEGQPESDEFEITALEARTAAIGDETTSYNVQLDLTAKDTEIAIESRLAALLVDRFVVSIESTTLSGNTDEALIAEALETMAARVEDEG